MERDDRGSVGGGFSGTFGVLIALAVIVLICCGAVGCLAAVSTSH